MLKARIIPTLLWKDHGLVKGVGFNSWRRVGSVLPAIKVYNIREVDEMIVVDITAGRDGREPDFFFHCGGSCDTASKTSILTHAITDAALQ